LEQSDAVATLTRVAGHSETLVASHPGNVNAVWHGVHSRTGRVLALRAADVADELIYGHLFDAQKHAKQARDALEAQFGACSVDEARATLSKCSRHANTRDCGGCRRTSRDS
jgi:hypothetical protein